MNRDLRKTEAAVLANYKKENPSVHFLAESEQAFLERKRKREVLYRDSLKFPPKMFAEAELLDLGAGTGESTVFFGLWGADCTLVEINEDASERSRQIFERYLADRGRHRFVRSSLFDFEAEDRFDIVVSEGVVHHTADKRQAFDRTASFVKPGGFLILGVGNAAGCFQRALQRVILFRFAENDDEIEAVAERLFTEHIDRAARIGQRTRRAVIFDSFTNPKVDFPSAEEVLTWFAAQGLRLYSSWPPILPGRVGDSGMGASCEATAFPMIGAPAEAAWLAHDREDAAELPARIAGLQPLATAQAAMTGYVNDFQPGQDFDAQRCGELLAGYRKGLRGYDSFGGFAAKAEALLDEIEAVLDLLSHSDLDGLTEYLAGTKHLFRGTGGLGFTRYVGYRPDGT